MGKKNLFMTGLLVTLLLLINVQLFSSEQENLIQIQKAIQEKGAKWTAGSNWVTKLSREEQKRLCGAFLGKPDLSESKLITLPQADNLPDNFDWRDNSGNWVTPVTNQGACGSCWDFSAVAQIEAWWKIHNANLDSMPDLSEQFILSCCEGGCDGGWPHLALDYVKNNGIPSETCFGYLADDSVPCDQVCPEWQNEAIKIPGWGYITLDEILIENIKNAVLIHPVSVTFIVYSDFNSYSGGVYEHVHGDVDGGHAVLIVGWDDELQCWICKNSWGPNWGENGYFRIKWGDCEMGQFSPFIWDEVITEPSLSVETTFLDFSLNVGDSTTEYITISNQGTAPVQFYSNDYEVDINYIFHSTDLYSYDGASWWCGEESIDGYNDEWLQFLETPVLNLSTTVSPKLTFMVNWSMENPASAELPWDGWDGCNVWVSSDSGVTFNVANPITPQYTCQSLWSFGHPEQGWNLGEGIAGWAGLSNGWVPAEFDLTPYISENVIIRFALASDQAYCSIDDSNLKGFFVDEIKVVDGNNTIFENSGENNGDLQPKGYGTDLVADWLSLKNASGVIQPNSSTDIELVLKTKDLAAGLYGGKIVILSNDISQATREISFRLNLSKPPYDLAIEEVWLPGENIPIFFPVELGAKIVNMGQNDYNNFDLLITATNNGQIFFNDTAHVNLLSSDESKIIKFESLLMTEPSNVDFVIEFIDLVDDYNDYNNSVFASTKVSNLVDGFETTTDVWSFEGGWARSNMGGHNGNFSAHVNGGTIPYSNNMNATMTFQPGLDITLIDNLTLKFWTKYVTEQDKDICYVEASGDKINWTTLDSFSGINYGIWNPHEIALTDFITQGYEKLWFRFRFTSDEANSFIGILIDDIEIYPASPTDVQKNISDNLAPTEWELSQNYPNPFNMDTNFSYSLKAAGDVKLTIYNINGKVVRNLINQRQSAGHQAVSWNGRDNSGNIVGSGVYLYQLEVRDKFFNTKKMILLK